MDVKMSHIVVIACFAYLLIFTSGAPSIDVGLELGNSTQNDTESTTNVVTTAAVISTENYNMTTVHNNHTMTTESMETTMAPNTTSNGTTSPSNSSTVEPTSPSKHVTTTHQGSTGKTTIAPTPAPATGFDGGSFVGGIAAGIGIAIIVTVVAFCFCRKKSGYSNLVN